MTMTQEGMVPVRDPRRDVVSSLPQQAQQSLRAQIDRLAGKLGGALRLNQHNVVTRHLKKIDVLERRLAGEPKQKRSRYRPALIGLSSDYSGTHPPGYGNGV